MPMLVDTGASTSVLPHSRVNIGHLSATEHHLVGAGGATIRCYSSRMTPLPELSVHLGFRSGRRQEAHPRRRLPVWQRPRRRPATRMYYQQRGPTPDPPLHPFTSLSSPGVSSASTTSNAAWRRSIAMWQATKSSPTRRPPPVSTTPSTLHCKVRPLSNKKLIAAKAAFAEMETAWVICRFNSPWSSPLHMVWRKNCGWRPCGDYRSFNKLTSPDRYPIPPITDALTMLNG